MIWGRGYSVIHAILIHTNEVKARSLEVAIMKGRTMFRFLEFPFASFVDN